MKDLHHDLGLGLFIVVVVQGIGCVSFPNGIIALADKVSSVISGLFAHTTDRSRRFDSTRSVLGKNWIRWGHIIAGITLMGLLITYAPSPIVRTRADDK
jgi:hypothetical protein